MADFINTVDILGDDALTDIILNRSVTNYSDNTATAIGNCAFTKCTALTSVITPAVTIVDKGAFSSCSALKKIDFTAVTSFPGSSFTGCSNLDTLIIRNTANVPKAVVTTLLNGTKIASGAGYIYVPAALLDSYKAATNWSKYASQYRALEDYTVDGTVTGELDPNKI